MNCVLIFLTKHIDEQWFFDRFYVLISLYFIYWAEGGHGENSSGRLSVKQLCIKGEDGAESFVV